MDEADLFLTDVLKRWTNLTQISNFTLHKMSHASSLANFIALWAKLGKGTQRTTDVLQVKWDNCRRLTVAAGRYADIILADLIDLLKESDRITYPLCDPLKMNLGLNRWLANDREEAYSDWLAWVLSELGSIERISRLLYGNLDLTPREFLECKETCVPDREVWVPKGHEGHSGRLDCVLRFGNDAIIVIEIKVIGAESSDTIKQAGYNEWLNDQQFRFKDKFLIAKSGDYQKGYEGFRLLQWEVFCKRLRKLLPALINERLLPSASLMAGFISAIEQNLLGLPSLTWVDRNENFTNFLWLIDRLQKTTEYLRNILNKEVNGNGHE